MAYGLDTICGPGDINAGEVLYLFDDSLETNRTSNPYQLYNEEPDGDLFPMGISSGTDASGFAAFVYSSGIESLLVHYVLDPLLDPGPGSGQTVQERLRAMVVSGPWGVHWFESVAGVPALPLKQYAPRKIRPLLVHGDGFHRISWPTAGPVCDDRNDGILYDVQRAISSGSPTWVTIAANLPESQLAYTDSALTPGTVYLYRIRAHVTYLGGRFPQETISGSVSSAVQAGFWGGIAAA